MTKDQTPQWEEELDEMTLKKNRENSNFNITVSFYHELKAFIQKAIESARKDEREKYEHLIRSVPIGNNTFQPVGGISTITYTPSIEIEAWKMKVIKVLNF